MNWIAREEKFHETPDNEPTKPTKREKPPGHSPAAGRSGRVVSVLNRIGALAVLAFGGNDGQAHFLPNRAREEAAQGMRLPAGGFEQFLGGCAVRALQQVQDLSAFAAVPDVASLLAFGRFLSGGGLLPRLGLFGRNRGATCASAGLFRGFRLRCSSAGGRFGRFCDHFVPLRGGYRDHMNHSAGRELQVKRIRLSNADQLLEVTE